ncbi:IS30 family transposase, partial [Bergeyella sp. RCAD1439]|uniref:IS30 family transposase n=1 Tax=Bergeyella anatis TaxID=3113737 RepID=UPI002E17F3A6|nr:IS30 family transposase [Bergeyella sp. RCAD1439]
MRFTEEVQREIMHLLSKDYSPEQIVGTLKLEGKETVSHERIYQFIWADKRKGGNLYKHLQTKGKRYRKRGCLKDKRGIITERKSIEERPEIVDKRCRTGDYEADLVLGKNHKMAILTMNDRATGYTFLELLQGKSAEEVQLKIERIITENQL